MRTRQRTRSGATPPTGRRWLTRAALATALLAPATWTTPGRAEPPADATAAQAAARYDAGIKAAKENKWADAYAAFSEAWQLKPHPQIAANLGRAALMSGKPREAAERLTYFLRESRDVSMEDRARVEQLLADARKQIGTLTLGVNREGAELALDGVAVGRAPHAGEIFVDAGRHVVEARAAGAPPARAELEVAAGSAQHVGLWVVEVEKKGAAPAAPRGGEDGGGGMRGPLIGAGIAATVAAAGAGVGLLVASRVRDSEREKQPEGKTFYRLDGEQAVLGNAAIWCFVAAGALGAGTLGYVLLTPKSEGDAGVRLEARGTGVSVRGAW